MSFSNGHVRPRQGLCFYFYSCCFFFFNSPHPQYVACYKAWPLGVTLALVGGSVSRSTSTTRSALNLKKVWSSEFHFDACLLGVGAPPAGRALRLQLRLTDLHLRENQIEPVEVFFFHVSLKTKTDPFCTRERSVFPARVKLINEFTFFFFSFVCFTLYSSDNISSVVTDEINNSWLALQRYFIF